MKRRFEFRLARVLRVRTLLERAARGEWAAAEAGARAAETAADAERARLARAHAELAELQQRPQLSPGGVLAAGSVLGAVRAAVARRREQAATLRFQAERAASAWREREREREGLQKLEQRARGAHQSELERADEAALEEASGGQRRAARAAAGAREELPGDSGSAEAPPAADEDHRGPLP